MIICKETRKNAQKPDKIRVVKTDPKCSEHRVNPGKLQTSRDDDDEGEKSTPHCTPVVCFINMTGRIHRHALSQTQVRRLKNTREAASVKIGCAARARRARKRTDIMREEKKNIAIEAQNREERHAALAIQNAARRRLRRSKSRHTREEREAAIAIQRVTRGNSGRERTRTARQQRASEENDRREPSVSQAVVRITYSPTICTTFLQCSSSTTATTRRRCIDSQTSRPTESIHKYHEELGREGSQF